MSKIIIIATKRYSINACDFDLMFRSTEHEVVGVLWHSSIARKGWFKTGKYKPSVRNSIVTKLTDLPNRSWSSHSQLADQIGKLDSDYICLGNGNDDTGKWLQNKIKAKFLFSEYGWLPWNECFYIDDQGAGPLSSIRQAGITELRGAPDNPVEYKYIKNKWNVGSAVGYRDYIYVPLQVDTPTSDGKPDFKFRFTPFKNNHQFLEHIRKVVPPGIKILVKNHPANNKPTRVPSGMVDISKAKINKLDLYQHMKAMVAINSTSVLEAMLVERPVFTYGEDIFTQKGLTFEKVADRAQFASLLRCEPPKDARAFINRLLERQAYRHRLRDDDGYRKNHYWVRTL